MEAWAGQFYCIPVSVIGGRKENGQCGRSLRQELPFFIYNLWNSLKDNEMK